MLNLFWIFKGHKTGFKSLTRHEIQLHSWKEKNILIHRLRVYWIFTAAACPLSIVFGSALQWFQWRKMIIIAYESRASNDDSVTAESFLICRIILWHVPSQDGGNLFICAEERGKGGQLASTIRQPSDKQYVTAWDSQTNERGSRNVHSGWTEFCNHPATLITCIALDIWSLLSHMLGGVTARICFLHCHCVCCKYEVKLAQSTSVMSRVTPQNHVYQHYIK